MLLRMKFIFIIIKTLILFLLSKTLCAGPKQFCMSINIFSAIFPTTSGVVLPVTLLPVFHC